MKSIIFLIFCFVMSFNTFGKCDYTYEKSIWNTGYSVAQKMSKAGCNPSEIADVLINNELDYYIDDPKAEDRMKAKRIRPYSPKKMACNFFCNEKEQKKNDEIKLDNQQLMRAYIEKNYPNHAERAATDLDKQSKKSGKEIADTEKTRAQISDKLNKKEEAMRSLTQKRDALTFRLANLKLRGKELDSMKIEELPPKELKKYQKGLKDAKKEQGDITQELASITKEIESLQLSKKEKAELIKSLQGIKDGIDADRDKFSRLGQKLTADQIRKIENLSDRERALKLATITFDRWADEEKEMENFMKDIKILGLQGENVGFQIDALMDKYNDKLKDSLFERYINKKIEFAMSPLQQMCQADSFTKACEAIKDKETKDVINEWNTWINNQKRDDTGTKWLKQSEIDKIMESKAVKAK